MAHILLFVSCGANLIGQPANQPTASQPAGPLVGQLLHWLMHNGYVYLGQIQATRVKFPNTSTCTQCTTQLRLWNPGLQNIKTRQKHTSPNKRNNSNDIMLVSVHLFLPLSVGILGRPCSGLWTCPWLRLCARYPPHSNSNSEHNGSW